MNDWRMIDTNTPNGLRQLDREIAERLGYSVYSYKTAVTLEYYLLVAPHHNPLTPDDYRFLLRAAGDYGKRINADEAWQDCAAYSTDIDAAMGLVENTKSQWLFSYNPTSKIGYGVDCWTHNHWSAGKANTLPLAICRAWLAWHDQQNAAARKGGVR